MTTTECIADKFSCGLITILLLLLGPVYSQPRSIVELKGPNVSTGLVH